MPSEESRGRTYRKWAWISVIALVAIVVAGILVVGSSEQPQEAPEGLNESASAFWEDCRSNGGTVEVKLEERPRNLRCNYENGTTEDYDADDW